MKLGANVPCAAMIAGEGGVAVTAGEEIAAVAVLLALAGDVDIHRPENLTTHLPTRREIVIESC